MNIYIITDEEGREVEVKGIRIWSVNCFLAGYQKGLYIYDDNIQPYLPRSTESQRVAFFPNGDIGEF